MDSDYSLRKMLPFGKIDPKKMHDMLKKVGVKSKEIEADEVIIKYGNKKIVIKNPKVSEIEFSGQKTFQIHGNVSEEEIEASDAADVLKLKDKDIDFVSSTTKFPREKARDALIEAEGNIAKAILILKKS